jgi:hypothetical protein
MSFVAFLATLPFGRALGELPRPMVELSSLLLVAALFLAILLSGRIVGGILAFLVVTSSISTSSLLRSIASSSFFVSSIDGLLGTGTVATTSTPWLLRMLVPFSCGKQSCTIWLVYSFAPLL